MRRLLQIGVGVNVVDSFGSHEAATCRSHRPALAATRLACTSRLYLARGST